MVDRACGFIQNIAGTSTAVTQRGGDRPGTIGLVAPKLGRCRRPAEASITRASRCAASRRASSRAMSPQQFGQQLFFVGISHLFIPAGSAFCSLLAALSSVRSVLHRSISICRARLSRDRTVPTGQPAIAAASSYDKPVQFAEHHHFAIVHRQPQNRAAQLPCRLRARHRLGRVARGGERRQRLPRPRHRCSLRPARGCACNAAAPGAARCHTDRSTATPPQD